MLEQHHPLASVAKVERLQSIQEQQAKQEKEKILGQKNCFRSQIAMRMEAALYLQ